MLSKTSEYALRAAVVIGSSPRTRLVHTREIARISGVPSRYLSKILHALVRGKVLTSQRGKGGGFRLARDPKEIKLIDVIRPFEDVLAAERCPLTDRPCSESNPCPMHEQWKPVMDGCRAFLQETTLADITDNRRLWTFAEAIETPGLHAAAMET